MVGDDCSLPDKGQKARRGLAGTIMVYKVCSAARCIFWPHILFGVSLGMRWRHPTDCCTIKTR